MIVDDLGCSENWNKFYGETNMSLTIVEMTERNNLQNPNSDWFGKSGLYRPTTKPKSKAQELLELSETIKKCSIQELQDEFERLSRNAAIGQRRSLIMSIDKKPNSVVDEFMNWLESEGFVVTKSNWRNEYSLHITW